MIKYKILNHFVILQSYYTHLLIADLSALSENLPTTTIFNLYYFIKNPTLK